MQKITPCLWFDTQGEEAANFYVSLFKNSQVLNVSRFGEGGRRPAGTAMTVSFELDGQEFIALNGGPDFRFNEAISFQVDCESQAEVDDFWAKLGDGGVEGQCGWLKDRYGISWQIVPRQLGDLLNHPDQKKAQKSTQAMLTMKRLDMDEIRRAAAED